VQPPQTPNIQPEEPSNAQDLLVNTLTEAEVPQPHFDQFEDPPSIAPFSVPPPSVPPPSVPQIEAPVSTVEGVGSLYPLFFINEHLQFWLLQCVLLVYIAFID